MFSAAGKFLGMSTFGPRSRVLVIPAATMERIVPVLLKEGHVARGWLGVALHPVAVPDALREQAGQSSGLMVMSLVEDGPAAKAGVVAGDIVLSVNDAPALGFRRLAGELAKGGIGRKAALRVVRGGSVLSARRRDRGAASRMSAAEPALAPRSARPRPCAADPRRGDALLACVRDAGHQSVDTMEAADVVLCVGDCPVNATNRTVVALGGPEGDQLGWLPPRPRRTRSMLPSARSQRD